MMFSAMVREHTKKNFLYHLNTVLICFHFLQKKILINDDFIYEGCIISSLLFH